MSDARSRAAFPAFPSPDTKLVRDGGYGHGEFEGGDVHQQKTQPRKTHRNHFARAARATILIGIGGAAAAAIIFFFAGISDSPISNPIVSVGSSSNARSAPASVPASNLIGKQAEAWGVRTCLDRIVAVADYLTRNTDYDFRLSRGKNNPDRDLLAGMIAARERTLNVPGISGLYAVPVGESECAAAYQTTMYYPEPCPLVHEKRFPVFSNELEFGDIAAAFTLPDGSATLYLLPAGDAACVVVKAETIR